MIGVQRDRRSPVWNQVAGPVAATLGGMAGDYRRQTGLRNINAEVQAYADSPEAQDDKPEVFARKVASIIETAGLRPGKIWQTLVELKKQDWEDRKKEAERKQFEDAAEAALVGSRGMLPEIPGTSLLSRSSEPPMFQDWSPEESSAVKGMNTPGARVAMPADRGAWRDALIGDEARRQGIRGLARTAPQEVSKRWAEALFKDQEKPAEEKLGEPKFDAASRTWWRSTPRGIQYSADGMSWDEPMPGDFGEKEDKPAGGNAANIINIQTKIEELESKPELTPAEQERLSTYKAYKKRLTTSVTPGVDAEGNPITMFTPWGDVQGGTTLRRGAPKPLPSAAQENMAGAMGTWRALDTMEATVGKSGRNITGIKSKIGGWTGTDEDAVKFEQARNKLRLDAQALIKGIPSNYDVQVLVDTLPALTNPQNVNKERIKNARESVRTLVKGVIGYYKGTGYQIPQHIYLFAQRVGVNVDKVPEWDGMSDPLTGGPYVDMNVLDGYQ